MAKQNVTFIERHVEKFVVGAGAAALLVIAYLYFVQDPHRVVVGGESLGPKAFYGAFREKANETLEKMRKANLPPEAKDPTAPKMAGSGQKPPPEIGVAFAPPGFPIRELPGVGPVAPLPSLAAILAPSKPVTTTGHASAILPPPQIISVGGIDQTPAQPPTTEAKDVFWISTIATVDRKKQREVFDAAKYMERRRQLVLAGMEMERQERLPNGDWGASESVQPYVPVQFVGLHDVELARAESGIYETTQESENYVSGFRQQVDAPQVQAAILRPPLQNALPKDPYAWAPPRKLTNPDLDLMDPMWGISFYTPELAGKGAAATAAPGLRPPPLGAKAGGLPVPKAPDAAALNPDLENKKLLDQANEHIKKQEFAEAAKILNGLAAMGETTQGGKPNIWGRQAQKLLEQYKTEIEEGLKAQVIKDQQKEKAMAAGFGMDLEPVWAHDMTVLPGRTYRYRIRFLAVNQYAGMPSYVKDPKDAMRMVCQGEWSQWSDPVMAEPDKRLFFTGAKEDTQTARLEYHQWAADSWKVDNLDIGLGQAVAGGGKRPFSYDAILADIEFHRPWLERSARKEGQIRYEAKSGGETQVITLVRLDGSVEERVAAQEAAERRAFQLKKEEERKRQEAPRQNLQPMNPMGPMMGPPMMGPRGMPGQRGGMRGRMEEGT